MYTTQAVVGRFRKGEMDSLPPPEYIHDGRPQSGVMMAVKAMKDHMTDEGWQIAKALEHGGYTLCGHELEGGSDVSSILQEFHPTTVVMQDKREWEGLTADKSANPDWRFHNVESLQSSDTFNLTVLKDSHQRPEYHREAAEQMNCHGWIVYYHPDIVHRLAPYTRREHLVRTYHTIDPSLVPEYRTENRNGVILTGALSRSYPLRMTIASKIRGIDVLAHPGYHRNGCDTPRFMSILSQYNVSICTCSIYGYALRKIIESVACGCTVITDLPVDDKLPYIDECLVKIDPYRISLEQLTHLITNLNERYDPLRAYHFANLAKEYYSYQSMGAKLVEDIETLRSNYGKRDTTRSQVPGTERFRQVPQ